MEKKNEIKMVTRKEVEENFANSGKASVKEILDEMDKYQMNLIEEEKLNEAMKHPYCGQCKKSLLARTKDTNKKDGDICASCIEDNKMKEERDKTSNNFKKLVEELNTMGEIKFSVEPKTNRIWARSKNVDDLVSKYGPANSGAWIERVPVYSEGGYWAKQIGNKFVLKAYCNHFYDLKFSERRIKADFGNKGIATRIYQRVEEEIGNLYSALKRKEEENNSFEGLVRKVMRDFPEAKRVGKYSYHSSHGIYKEIPNIIVFKITRKVKEREIEFDCKLYGDCKSYSLVGIPYYFDATILNEMLDKMIESMNKQQEILVERNKKQIVENK